MGLIVSGFFPARAQAAEIWMSGVDPLWRAVHGWSPSDYMQLFASPAGWSKVASKVNVFELTKRFVRDATDDQLRYVTNGLRRLHIKLSIQATPLEASRACGLGVEGYGPAVDMEQLALRLKRLGANLSYLRMDEPLYYGHVFNGGPNRIGCKAPIGELARETATKLAPIRHIFPEVKIGDIEPFGLIEPETAEWPEMLAQWASAFQRATGKPLAFIQADIVWRRPNAIRQFLAGLSIITRLQIPFGVIYNGVPTDPSGSVWVADAENHYKLIEGTLGIRPSQVVFQTWTAHPRQMLPETAPNTLSHLILTYLEWKDSHHGSHP